MSDYHHEDVIQKLLNEELSEEELASLQERFANDGAFADEVMQYLEIRAALRATKKVQKAHKEIAPGLIQLPRRKKYRIYLVAASVVLLAFIGAFVFLLNRPPNHDVLFTDYYQPYKSKINTRNPSDSSASQASQLMEQAFAAYKKQAYQEGIQGFERVLNLEPQNTTALFYAAQCYLNINKTERAILSFQEVVAGEYSTYTQDASWYLALAYLKKREAENCRKELQKIIANKGFYKEKAEQLMRDIERL